MSISTNLSALLLTAAFGTNAAADEGTKKVPREAPAVNILPAGTVSKASPCYRSPSFGSGLYYIPKGCDEAYQDAQQKPSREELDRLIVRLLLEAEAPKSIPNLGMQPKP